MHYDTSCIFVTTCVCKLLVHVYVLARYSQAMIAYSKENPFVSPTRTVHHLPSFAEKTRATEVKQRLI